jgi:integrase
VLTDAELKALLTHQPSPRWDRLHRAINLLLLTGQRRGELALARWSEIDFDEALWRIPGERTKTGAATTVPLSAWAVEEFKALKREAERSPFVFPLEADRRKVADPKLLTRNLARAFEQRFLEIGIKEVFTLHDLRRTCRTGLAKLKVPPHIAERVLNHAQEKIAGTYDVHEYIDEKREALNRWADHLRGLAT